MENKENNIVEKLIARRKVVIDYLYNIELPETIQTADIQTLYENSKEIETIDKLLSFLKNNTEIL